MLLGCGMFAKAQFIILVLSKDAQISIYFEFENCASTCALEIY